MLIADDDDARLAASAIYRLGCIVAAQRIHGPTYVSVQLDLDRRYEQLIECIELRIRSIKVADLSRYLWAATTLRVLDEDQANIALNEYTRRLTSDDESCAVTVEEGAAILWAVGCVRDTYGWTSMTLITLLCEHLNEEELSKLPTKSIVRVFWSLALHNRYDVDLCKEGFSVMDSRGWENVSATNAVDLLWSIAQYKDLIEPDFMRRFLDRIIIVIEDRDYPLGVKEYGLAADALVTLHDTTRQSITKNEIADSILRPGTIRLHAINVLIEKTMRSLVNCFTSSHRSSSTFSISFVISILRAAVGAKVTHMKIWDFAMSHMQNMMKMNVNITVVEAANMLELIAFVPRVSTPIIPTIPTAMTSAIPTDSAISEIRGNNKYDGSDGSNISNSSKNTYSVLSGTGEKAEKAVDRAVESAQTSESFGSFGSFGGQRVVPGGTKDPKWHGIAGRLAAITATHAGQVKDKILLINACWAVAALGYPYRKLLTAVRRSIQFALHELSPNSLSRLVVAVAAEECQPGNTVTAGSSGLLASPRLDREFVDQVALSVYYNLADMTPLSDQVSAMVAVACLGRLSSFEMRRSPTTLDEGVKGCHRPVTVSSTQIKSLSNGVLIKLFWAMHRLPDGVAESSSIEAVLLEISTRNLTPRSKSSLSKNTSGDFPDGEGEVTRDDLKLYVRALAETKIPSDLSRPEGSQSNACNALFLQLQAHVKPSERMGLLHDVHTYESLYLSEVEEEASTLCDVVQYFIELKWHLPAASSYLEQQFTELSVKYNGLTRNDDLCGCAYHIGRLEELIKIFRNLPYLKTNESRYDIGKQLSRWLGRH